MKLSIATLLLIPTAQAFAPTTFVPKQASTALRMSDEEAAPAAGKLVPIKEDTIEFTAGILGGAAGFVVGGPVLGAIGACIGNYAAKNGEEIGEITQAVSKTSIEIFNYLLKLDSKYEVLTKAQASLAEAIEKVKANGNVQPETLEKLESAYASTTSKINEINEEYDLVGSGMTALGVIGDLVEKAIKKAGELNEEYKLTDKAMSSVNNAVSSASKKVA
eukprot:CAMPEP_0116026514 /NCGR_PEP_ID=MMETSP0321-20121206/13914_1 /TAXON_ID=163516 /ORGANISM="Leptocylindrus danicus var. danicus, Strain B650" /LENGTH=218 /DNA_ID=CAMNT_0003499363 /DNA_START=102 /DNA_END=758 /DNA_ORIENTATION=+